MFTLYTLRTVGSVVQEGDDIIELSTHGRDETGFVVAYTASQQGIGETFFVDPDNR